MTACVCQSSPVTDLAIQLEQCFYHFKMKFQIHDHNVKHELVTELPHLLLGVLAESCPVRANFPSIEWIFPVLRWIFPALTKVFPTPAHSILGTSNTKGFASSPIIASLQTGQLLPQAARYRGNCFWGHLHPSVVHGFSAALLPCGLWFSNIILPTVFLHQHAHHS